ncbi:quinoprotein relay system zinc metallohydrolase 2 [soil metagenome]
MRHITRRVAPLPVALAALLAVAAGTAPLAGCAMAAGPAPGSMAAPQATEVASGVYMVQGAPGEVDADNLGRIGNAGFIVGPSGVVAIDTGTSYRQGVALLAAIRRVTDKPVRLALITHTRQEFLFGAMAYREQGIRIAMHRKAAGLMVSRCERCLKTLKQTLGDDAMQGTAMFEPDEKFDQGFTDESIGRPVQVMYFGHSSGPGDVAVFDPASGTLFAGGLLDQMRIPDVQDSELEGWTHALKSLHELPIRKVVPGHGPMGPASVIASNERYLSQLQTKLLALLESGAALSEVPDAASLPEFAGWDQYETTHRRNASILFVRFERQRMFERAGQQE